MSDLGDRIRALAEVAISGRVELHGFTPDEVLAVGRELGLSAHEHRDKYGGQYQVRAALYDDLPTKDGKTILVWIDSVSRPATREEWEAEIALDQARVAEMERVAA